MKTPITIAFCGIDGSGKTTQVSLLSNYLQESGYKVLVTKAKMINFEVLLNLSEKLFGDRYNYHPGIPPELMNAVLACDVVYHYLQIEKIQNEYDFIICDRHKLCYTAYSYAYGTNMKWINEIFALIHKPDLTFYMNLDVDIAYSRLINRKDKLIRTDENYELLAECKLVYESLIKDVTDIYIINGNDSKDNIFTRLKECVNILMN